MKRPVPSMLVVACFSVHDDALAWAEEQLRHRFGPILLTSPDFDFNQTTYYEATMGPGLRRLFLAFAQLVESDHLAEIKLWTIGLERQLAESGRFPELRPLNLDPGFIQLGKFILAST